MQVRVRVWPRLMGINMLETVTILPEEEELASHPEYNQGTMDIILTGYIDISCLQWFWMLTEV